MTLALCFYVITVPLMSVVTYGMIVADFQRDPLIGDLDRWREDCGFALIYALVNLVFPFVCPLMFFSTGFARRGLLFRKVSR